LANDEQATVEIRNWDLAFAIDMFEVTVLSNPVNGVTVYKTPYAVADFATVDTAGYANWQMLYNEFNDWSAGTLQNAADTASSLDYGWGNYNPITHVVEGTRVFLLKLEQNSTVAFKKFYVVGKDVSGNWQFRLADLDGSNDATRTIDVSDYAQRHFAYFAIDDDQFLNREPANTSWDLLFTRYYAPVGGGVFYPVTGVLANKNTEIAKAESVDVNTVLEAEYAGSYSENISTIGYDWKTFNGAGFDVQDSLVYFVRTQSSDVFKLRFTGFESADGLFVFDKTLVFTSVEGSTNGVYLVDLYPNPASDAVRLVWNASHQGVVTFDVCNTLGQRVLHETGTATTGLNVRSLDVSLLPNGIYHVTVQTEIGGTTRRFVKQ
ncbi:MAG TPA: T9SS type A sorting domain-containing protein, partial [Chitinophagales bacterium]|nr:T9SS type A sorting domain-containing protein [Chitinophagales bacterium]